MEKQKIINNLEKHIRYLTIFFFKWLSEDGEALGYILAVLHILGTIAIAMCLLLSHTIYPVLWFQLFTFALILIVWVQHIILNVCVISVAESVFTSSAPPSHILLTIIYSTFIGNHHNDPLNLLVLCESVLVLTLGLELTAKLFEYFYKINSIILS
jgi:hypothetical protein